jgi:chemotaxis protein CheD
MTTQSLTQSPTIALVGMGQIAAARAPNLIRCVLGSCIGVSLFHARSRVGVMAHVVLANSAGRTDAPGKYADTAVPRMIELLLEHGGALSGATAKIAGGASMFGASGPFKIGSANTEAVLQALAKAGIRVTAKHVGEQRGRRVTLDCSNGELTIEVANSPPMTI